MKNPKMTGKPVAVTPHHGHHAGKKPAPKKAAPHKPAHVPASVRIARHKAAQKAARTRAKNARKAAHHKKRGLAVAGAVACCAAEALAASLWLAGHPVTDDDVLELHRLAGGTADEGVPIVTALEAAREFGLAGVQLADIWNVDSSPVSGLITGVTLPGGPHALTLDPSGLVWSWGELHDPAGLSAGLIEEAWLVDWEV